MHYSVIINIDYFFCEYTFIIFIIITCNFFFFLLLRTTAPAIDSTHSHLFCDPKTVCHPPSSLHLPSSVKPTVAKQLDNKANLSSPRGSASSSPAHTSSSSAGSLHSDAEEDEGEDEGEEPDDADEEDLKSLEILDSSEDQSTIRSVNATSSSTAKLTVSSQILHHSPSPNESEGSSEKDYHIRSPASPAHRAIISEHRPLSAEPSLEKEKGCSTSSSPTMSVSSIFSRTGSQSHSGSGSPSFMDRFDRITSEAREKARGAKAAAVEASKTAIKATKKEVGGKKLLKNLQALGEPMREQAKELWRNSQDESGRDHEFSSSSIISSVAGDFNGFADKTTTIISGFFGSKASGLAEKMQEKAQKYGPFPKGKINH